MIRKVYIFTGAGISAESGMDTFRGSQGAWATFKAEAVATLEAWTQQPLEVWLLAARLKAASARAKPNEAHRAVARMFQEFQSAEREVILVTQNIDTLHERALENIRVPAECCLAMHGKISESRCTMCMQVWNDPFLHFNADGEATDESTRSLSFDSDWPTLTRRLAGKTDGLPLSPCCSALLRPNIVLFGEEPFHLNRCYAEVQGTDVFVGIGTSGVVAPANEFVKWTVRLNDSARTIFINTNAEDAGAYYRELKIGTACALVPSVMRELCSSPYTDGQVG